MASRVLIIATIPVLLCSLLLLHFSAPRALLVQQAVVFIAAIAMTLVSARRAPASASSTAAHRLALPLLLCLLCVPLLAAEGPEPRRWIVVPGIRLYVAPLVLPLFLLRWDRALRNGGRAGWLCTGAGVAVALALFAHPDAAQLTAFAVSAIPILAAARVHAAIRSSILLAIGSAAAVAWTLPDPLVPVPHVEGVFELAAARSGGFLVLAIAAAAAPIIALWYVSGRLASPGLFAAGVYFAVPCLLAPLQATPVPLLGFGAGPIAGYFLLVGHAMRMRPPAA